MTEFQMYEIAKKFANQGDRVLIKGSINTDAVLVIVGTARAEFSGLETLQCEDASQFEALLSAKLGRSANPVIG